MDYYESIDRIEREEDYQKFLKRPPGIIMSERWRVKSENRKVLERIAREQDAEKELHALVFGEVSSANPVGNSGGIALPLDRHDGETDLAIERSATCERAIPCERARATATAIAGSSLAGSTLKASEREGENAEEASVLSMVKVKMATPSLTSTKAKSSDRYPAVKDDASRDVLDALSALKELCVRVQKKRDYASERENYVRLHFQLNRAKRLAPAFRPVLPSCAEYGNEIHFVVLRDQIVIDYHWCHTTGMELQPEEVDHAALLNLERDFDFEAAFTLAKKKWKREYRGSEAMVLTVFQQCQFLHLRGPELQLRVKNMGGVYRASNGKYSNPSTVAKQKIRAWLGGREDMKGQIPVYESLWTARELLGKGGEKWIPSLVALILGQARVLDRKTIRGKLATLEKRLSV